MIARLNSDGDMTDNFNDSLVAVLPRLRTLALALTRNRADAEDLVHDAVTNALAARDSFEPGSNFSAWIYRIMRNRFISIVRKRRPTSSIEEVSEAAMSVAASCEHRLMLRELGKAFYTLPFDQREALVMVAVHNLSYGEIASATDCAIGTAKSRAFRARRKLEALCELSDSTPERAIRKSRANTPVRNARAVLDDDLSLRSA